MSAQSSVNAALTRRRAAPGRPFPPGKSGNPSGRPKSLIEVQRAARTLAVEAINTLAAIMRTSRSHTARIAAAQALLDRGFGRPPQAIAIAQLEGPDGKPVRAPTFGISFSNGGPGVEDESETSGDVLQLPSPAGAAPALLLSPPGPRRRA